MNQPRYKLNELGVFATKEGPLRKDGIQTKEERKIMTARRATSAVRLVSTLINAPKMLHK